MEEQEKQKKSKGFNGLIHALTLTKSNTQLLEDPLTDVSPTRSGETDETVDLSNISNKEERVLFELLNSLNENLELLDGVKEVLDRNQKQVTEDSMQVIDELNESIPREDDKMSDLTEDQEEDILPKRVAKGRAVFISPEKEKPMNEQERKEKRSEMIAELMIQETERSEEFSKNAKD